MEDEHWFTPWIVFFILAFIVGQEAKAEEVHLEPLSVETVSYEQLPNAGSFKSSEDRLYFFVPCGLDGAMPMKAVKDAADLASIFLIAGHSQWQVASQSDVEAVRTICGLFAEVSEHMACSSVWIQRET